ncbi:unnamed protein product [Phyllotreta striolata]|uniref:Uncharacterized protein n=1 Tax=Phyllotreta striolata TaxID=444603 RepID=A0A9N9T9T7_PHYSR|nr:unnamed protein product [Phyllotreta striolata]
MDSIKSRGSCGIQSVPADDPTMKLSLVLLIVFVSALYFENSFCEDLRITGNEDEKKSLVEPQRPNKYAPLWFGPRVGRKKRNLVEEENKNFDREEMEVLLEFIRKSPWTIMLFGNGGSRLINYNPKEDRGLYDDDEFTEMVQRSMFAPRLGRSAFYPRLGRGNSAMD